MSSKRSAIAERVYRALLTLYPARFRERFEAGLIEVFRARWTEARGGGPMGGVRAWTELMSDLVRAVPEAWRQERRFGRPGGGRPVGTHHGKGGGGMMDGFWQDLRFALRTVLRAPAFAALAVATLAIGIGSTSAIFGVVNTVLLKPLPYGNPDGVVTLWSSWRGFDKTWLSVAEAQAWASMTETLEGTAYWYGTNVNFTSADRPERVSGAGATHDLDDVLEIDMALGRFFTEAEGIAAMNGPAETIVVSHDAWTRRWEADPALVGRTVEVNGRLREVVGVMPEGFRLPTDFGAATTTDVYFPYDVPRAVPSSFPVGGGSHFLYGAARLRTGSGPDAAAADVRRVVDRLHAEFGAYPEERAFAPIVLSAERDILGALRPAVLTLLGTVAFVLLIACANVANLLLVRARVRESEWAVRAALGAGRGRLVRQLLTESTVLAVVGGAAGLALAWGGIELFRLLDPGTLPRIAEIGIDVSVVGFSVAATLGTVLLFGVLPALRASRSDLRSRMGGRGESSSGHSRWQGSLVAAEMGLAVVLVIGAGLTVRTFERLTAIDPGFDGSDVMSVAVSLPTTTYATPEAMLDFHREALRSIEALPAVERASGARLLPLASQIGDWGVQLEAYDPPPGHPMNGDWQFAAPGYFEVMGIPVRQGRPFESGDDENGAPVVVVNEAFVRHFWPGGEDPIGRRMAMSTGAAEPAWATIVGVVGDVTHNGLTAEVKRKFYIPLGQWTAASGGSMPTSMRYVARAAGDPAALGGAIRGVIRTLDPTLAVAEVRTVDDIKTAAVSLPRFTAVLMGVFSLIAGLLAVIGIYGVVSYGVSQKVREIGVRMALGAPRESVVRLMLSKGLAMIGVGLALGTVAAFLLSGFLGALLYQVPPTDPVTFVTVVLGFGGVAVLATWWPARRAARVDPARTLRTD